MKTINRILSIVVIFILALSNSTATVFAQDTVDTIYLPLISGGAVVDASDVPIIYPDGSIPSPDAPPVNVLEIKPCTNQEMTVIHLWNGVSTSTPDQNSTEGCLLPSTASPLDEPWGPVVNDEGVTASDLFITRKFAMNSLNCQSACTNTQGLLETYFIHSAKPATLTGGANWGDYWFANYTSLRNATTITCQSSNIGNPTIAAGIGQGRLTASTTINSPTIFWVLAVPGSCYGYTTGVTVLANSALLMHIYRDATGTGVTYWTGRVWLNGSWSYIFTHQQLPIDTSAKSLLSGMEVGATNADFTKIKVPLNFAHKILLKPNESNQVPYNDLHLPTALKDKSSTLANSPWNVMDIHYDDFTSLSAEIN